MLSLSIEYAKRVQKQLRKQLLLLVHYLKIAEFLMNLMKIRLKRNYLKDTFIISATTKQNFQKLK